MNNFGRALKLALRYRATVAAATGCAFLVAVLWGGNIGALYPVVEVCFQGESVSQHLRVQIKHSEDAIAGFASQKAELEAQAAQAAPNQRNELQLQVDRLSDRLAAEQSAVERYQWIQPYVDRYSPDSPFQTVVLVMCFIIVATLIKGFFMAVGSMLADRLAQLAMFDLRKQFFRRTLRMDMASFGESGTADLLARFTNDLEGVTSGISTLFGRAIREPLKMVACLLGAAWICWRLLVLSLIVAPIAAYLVSRLAKTLKRANRRAMEEVSAIYNILVETFHGVKVVKAFTMERHERRRLHQASKKLYRRTMRIAVFDGMINPVTEFLGICMISLAILAGAYLALNQQTHLFGIHISDRPLTLSSLLIFYGMLAGVSDPARKLSEVFNRLQRASAASDRVFQLLDREPSVVDPPRPRRLARHHLDLRFDQVRFAYPNGQPVLEEIDLRVRSGETVAIVGPNGCGKSTLANLVPRFYDPIGGAVLLDGVDLREVSLRDLRRQIGLVTQETVLFEGTVLNNIQYGCPQATREQIIEAAKKAHAHKFIENKLEKGYETLVGAHGHRLSGGQRQRIALARAILRDPAILILDEATSQIDLESEQLIHQALEEFARDRTAIIITHRLATLALADRVVVMEGGRIIDVGTHEQLISRCGLYQRLYQIQFREAA
jgi:ATP-binding cassette subfamily B protein/subfamily B ATP-binding cassette protein MsbA